MLAIKIVFLFVSLFFGISIAARAVKENGEISVGHFAVLAASLTGFIVCQWIL